jgi:hypothetical protein
MTLGATLPLPLVALGKLRRFVNYETYPDPERPNKTIKRPVDVRTGVSCNSNLPEHQYTFDEASATGRPVGFVFANDGYFFVDIDGAIEANPAGGQQWSALAHEICARFLGAAVEVSQSGTGLHIIGRGLAPPHSCKNIPHHIELYTNKRFCALTGTMLRGDASIDQTAALVAFAERYFPPNPHGDIAGWSAEPVPEWDGPTDDAILLRAALASGKKNAANVFGAGNVTFADLWDADADKLAAKWPSDKGGYDASQADAALAAHLAFWTGKNHSRIRDLMHQSRLARQKWEDRPDWLDTTILRAASKVDNVFTKRAPPTAPGMVAGVPMPPRVALTAKVANVELSPLDGVVFDGDQSPPAPSELIKGLLPCVGVAFMGGQSGAGKTFIAIDLAVALAIGGPVEFFGRRVKERVGVAIFAAEGRGTIASRLHVAKDHRSATGRLPIVTVMRDFNLADQGEVALFIDALAAIADRLRANFGVRLGLIIIDTLAAGFGLVDENSNAEASATIRTLRRIGEAAGALVMPVHHYGKSEDTGLRGASGYRAGADVVLSVLAKRNETTGAVSDRRIALAKSRTHEEGPISGFDLVYVPIGFDEDGGAFGSCIVVPNAKPISSAIGKRETQSHADFHRAYDSALRDHGIELPAVNGQAARRMVKTSAVKEEFARCRQAPDGDPVKQRDAARKAFKHALLSLGSKYSEWEDEHGIEWMQRVG